MFYILESLENLLLWWIVSALLLYVVIKLEKLKEGAELISKDKSFSQISCIPLIKFPYSV